MPKEIFQPQLATYEDEYFYTNAANTGVVFRCPVTGVTTSGSQYPRTELRQMKNGGSDEASWSNANATWTMTCTLSFDELPGGSNNGVVGMQIHDSVDDVTVLRCDGTELWVTKGDNPTHQRIMTGYVLGTVITVTVQAVKGGGFDWYLNGNQVGHRGGTKSGCYLKAGCYVQANSSNGSGHGQVTIYTLSVTKT